MEVQVERAFKSYYISSFVGKKNNTKADRVCMKFSSVYNTRFLILKSTPFNKTSRLSLSFQQTDLLLLFILIPCFDAGSSLGV